VILVGFMGSGKTTIGGLLGARLGRPFVDLDDRIEASAGRSISDIFAADGEAAFRDLEAEAFAALLQDAGHPHVIAVGGGAFAQPRNRQAITDAGATSVFLECDLEVMRERVAAFTHRPNARDPERFARLYQERLPAYRLADHVVETSTGTPEEAAAAIAALVENGL
jgi:shikimate kinase